MYNRLPRAFQAALPATVIIGSVGFSLWGVSSSHAQDVQNTAPVNSYPAPPTQSYDNLPRTPSDTQTPALTTDRTPVPQNQTFNDSLGSSNGPNIQARRNVPQPQPANPLVIIGEQRGTGNRVLYYDRSGNLINTPETVRPPMDYRYVSPYPAKKPVKPLRLFGYSFFEPARQLIVARRAYFQSRYQRNNTISAYPNLNNNRTNSTINRRNYPVNNPNSPYNSNNGNTLYNNPNSSYNNNNNSSYNNANGNATNTIGGYNNPNGVYSNPDGTYNNTAGNFNPDGVNNTNGNGVYNYGTDNTNNSIGSYNNPNGVYNSANQNGNPSDPNSYNNSTASGDLGYGPSNNPNGSNDTNPVGSNQNRSPYGGTQSYQSNGLLDPNGYSPNGTAQTDPYGNPVNPANIPDSQDPNALAPQQSRSQNRSLPNNQIDTFSNQDNSAFDNTQNDTSLYPNGQRSNLNTTNAPYEMDPYSANPSRTDPYGTNLGPNSNQTDSALLPYSSSNSVPPPTGIDSVNAYQRISDPLTQLFNNVVASAPASYQISGGDVVTVEYSTPTQATRTYNLLVDPQGAIMLPSVGRVILRGQTIAQAEKSLSARFRRYFQNATVSLTLSQLRTISVTVSGEAFVPGTYEVPSVSTVINILYAAGGPTADGTLRAIEVRRQGRLLHRFDFYQFLFGGDKTAGITLEPGDQIYIPPRLSRITIRGEVRQPAIFELTDQDMLRDALHYAGGVKPSGVAQRIQINTLDPGTARVLRDVNLANSSEVNTTPLYDGDVIDVFSVQTTLANRVTIEGAVDQPGDYALIPHMHVSDLLERARGTLYNAYLTHADLYRSNDDNTHTLVSVDLDKVLAHDPTADVSLKRWDLLKVYTRQEVAWTGNQQVTVRGPVQRPGVYPLSKSMHVSDLLRVVGGTSPDAYLNRATLLHQRGDGTFVYDDVNLAAAIVGDAAQDPLLQDNDILGIYTTSQAHFEPDHLVTILGEVVTPGIYPRGEGMHLSDLLKRAGGFRPGAMTQVKIAHAYRIKDAPSASLQTAAIVFDQDGQTSPGLDALLQDGDVVTVQGTGGFRDFVSVVTVKGAVNRPGPIALTGNMRLSDVIREAGGLRQEAFPEGVEFSRDPKLLASTGQHDLATIINSLNELLNRSAYKRALAVSDLDRATAINQVNSDAAGLAIPGITAVASAPTGGAALTGNLTQHDLVTPARILSENDLNPHGNIAVNLADALKHPNGDQDIAVLNGDTLTIPEKPTTVQVVGAVFNARGVLYKPGASLSYYVDLAGGYAPDAARDRIEIIHAGGGLIPANNVRELRPGDVVLVPTRVLAEKISRNSNGFDAFFKGLTNSAITYAVLKSVFKF